MSENDKSVRRAAQTENHKSVSLEVAARVIIDFCQQYRDTRNILYVRHMELARKILEVCGIPFVEGE